MAWPRQRLTPGKRRSSAEHGEVAESIGYTLQDNVTINPMPELNTPTLSEDSLAVLTRDMRQVRPDLTPAEAELAVKHLLATVPKDKALTGYDFRKASFQALGGALYAQAYLRQADDSTRPVVVQLFSGRVIDGTLDALVAKLRANPYDGLYDVSEVARLWMNRQVTLVFEGFVESPSFGKVGKSLAINFATFIKEARTNTDQLQALWDQLRAENVTLVVAPAGLHD